MSFFFNIKENFNKEIEVLKNETEMLKWKLKRIKCEPYMNASTVESTKHKKTKVEGESQRNLDSHIKKERNINPSTQKAEVVRSL